MVTDPGFELPWSRFTAERSRDDLLLWFENRDRYIAQSAATKAGAPAPLPPRAPITRSLHTAELYATSA